MHIPHVMTMDLHEYKVLNGLSLSLLWIFLTVSVTSSETVGVIPIARCRSRCLAKVWLRYVFNKNIDNNAYVIMVVCFLLNIQYSWIFMSKVCQKACHASKKEMRLLNVIHRAAFRHNFIHCKIFWSCLLRSYDCEIKRSSTAATTSVALATTISAKEQKSY